MATNLAKKVGSGELTVKEFPQIVSKINTAIPLPSLPQLLFKLIEVCRDNSAGIENIVRIALLDPAVAAKLIRLSSNWLQGTADVRSLEKYIAVLGPANIRKLALVALATPITNTAMRHSAAKLFQFWHHSIQCAVLARKLAEREGSVSPGEAYLAGLLHDIGQLLLWTNFKKEYDTVFQDRPNDGASISREENRIGTNHCEAGWRLVRETSLHPMIADAILYHHRPAEEIRHALPHVRIVHAANLICHREQDNYSLADELQAIGLQQTPAQIGSMVAETKRTVETVYRFLGLRPDVEFGSDLGESSEGFLPIYNFLREFREFSLVHIAAGEINADSERKGVQKELCLTMQILFDILPVCFFFYNPTRNVLKGTSTAGSSADSLLDGIEIPVKPGASLAAAAVINNEIVDSFGYLTGKRVSIADEQLLRLLGTEGLVCIPLENRGKHVGTIVGGIDESQFPVLSEQIALLRQFADRAAIALAEKEEAGRDGRSILDTGAVNRDAVRRVIHEVNNPLGIIKNYLNILGPKVRDIDQGQEEIELIREEIDRIPGIIQQLTASEESPGSAGTAAEIVDINNILYDLSKLLQKSVLEPARISLHFTPDPQLPSFPGNRGNLVQVFTNLLKNSIEAMPDGGNIFIHTAYRQKSAGNGRENILIEIRDDGPGIPDAIRQHLFTPGHSTKGPENFGLGLSICQEIIHRYNGDIKCQTKEDKGTTFQIALPCSVKKKRAETEKSI